MQWSCQQGYYNESTPYCYHDTMSPVDDDFPVGDIGTYANECSDETCCDESCEYCNRRGMGGTGVALNLVQVSTLLIVP